MMMDIFGKVFANMQKVFLASKSPPFHLSTFYYRMIKDRSSPKCDLSNHAIHQRLNQQSKNQTHKGQQCSPGVKRNTDFNLKLTKQQNVGSIEQKKN